MAPATICWRPDIPFNRITTQGEHRHAPWHLLDILMDSFGPRHRVIEAILL